MRIKAKLILGFLIIAVICLLSSATTVVFLFNLKNDQNEVLEQNAEALGELESIIDTQEAAISIVKEVRAGIYEEYQMVATCLLNDDQETIIYTELMLGSISRDIEQNIDQLEELTTSGEQEGSSDIASDLSSLRAAHSVFLDYLTDNKEVDGSQNYRGVLATHSEAISSLENLQLLKNEREGLVVQSEGLHADFNNNFLVGSKYETVFTDKITYTYGADTITTTFQCLYLEAKDNENKILDNKNTDENFQDFLTNIDKLHTGLNSLDPQTIDAEGKNEAIKIIRELAGVVETEKTVVIEINETEIQIAKNKAASIEALEALESWAVSDSGDTEGVGFFIKALEDKIIDSVTQEQLKEADEIRTEADLLNDSTQQTTTNIIYLTIVIAVLAILICVAVGYVVAVRISTPIVRLTNIAKDVVQKGDMDAVIDIESDDEIGDLATMYSRLINMSKNALMILEQMQEKDE